MINASRKHYMKACITIAALTIQMLQCTELLITQPGIYKLGDTLVASPTGADSIVIIATSNVVFDLGERVILQGNIVANVNGIVINSSLNDITIQNGTVQNCTGNGLVINQSCTRIKILNVRFVSCATTGISIPATVGNAVSNCRISGCQFFGCCNGAAASSVINVTQSNTIELSNIIIVNTLGSANLSMIGLTSCSMCDLNTLQIKNNSTTGLLFGILDNAGSINRYSNIVIENNSSTLPFTGLNFITINANLVKSVHILLNLSSANSVTGFSLSNGDNCQFNSCLVEGNSSVTGTIGFNFLNTGNQNIITDCLVTLNSSSGAGALTIGFNFNNGSIEAFNRCFAANNSSTNGPSIGAFFQGTGGSNSTFRDCMLYRNVGINAANSFGINRAVGTNNLFTRTIGFNNNTTPANQLTGLPAGSIQTPAVPATSNLNTLSSPWANLAIGS